jgi:D-lactate dehydrogenase
MSSTSSIEELKSFCKKLLPSIKVFTSQLELLAKGTDAGFYRLVPQLVLQVNDEKEVVALLKQCSELKIPVTFKAGGTSLSGQTITDSVLIELGPDFTKHWIAGDGSAAAFQPGVRGGYANMLLARYGKKIGPSPASINAAKIGGIVANNASGSSYGIATNSYNTVLSMRIVTPDGTILDTGNDESRRAFEISHGGLLNGLLEIKRAIESNTEIGNKIKHKYRLKNTTGYGMNSFVDFDDPIDIYQHLMVGSEGTLGFISEVTFKTIDDHKEKACALLFFKDVREAAAAVMPLRECAVSAAELMDRNALRAVEDKEGMPTILKSLPDGSCALLVETSAPDNHILLSQIDEITKALQVVETLYPVEFTFDRRQYNTLWKVRKGLLTSGAAKRPKGTACLIEDIAFPAEVLGEALVALNQLLSNHGFGDTVMWGHLLDGNIHFLVTPDFNLPLQMDNYKSFMHQLAILVVDRFDGSLKAEHGTGRNMAPFVEKEWGKAIYDLMKQTKRVCDPLNIMNPGVLINDDPEVYAINIKPFTVANPLIDDCIECGFCESSCPSRNFTMTPRQRIVLYREITRLQREKRFREASRLARQFDFNGIDSCATDGMCAVNCPVEIDTGILVKELRTGKTSNTGNRVAAWIARHFGFSASVARVMLNAVWIIGRVIPYPLMDAIAKTLHKLSGRHIPLWNRHLPKGAPNLAWQSDQQSEGVKVVYFPACINRIFGIAHGYDSKESVTQKTISVLHKAGYEIVFPQSTSKLCCGMAFDSKGYKWQGMMKLKELEAALLEASENGKYPVLCDMSPCLLRMKKLMDKRLKLYDQVSFTLEHLQDKLVFTKVKDSVTVHSTCSNTKMGQEEQLVELASLCAREVVRPLQTGCCGWAGDKGFNMPALNASALRFLKDEIPVKAKNGYSTSRTCEIGLSLHSGISYQSVMYLVDEATSKRSL